MMNTYLKQRYKSYLGLAIGVLIGFVLVRIFVDEPDYKFAMFPVLIGLACGELFVFMRWRNKQKKSCK